MIKKLIKLLQNFKKGDGHYKNYERAEGWFVRPLTSFTKEWFNLLEWLFILASLWYLAFKFDFSVITAEEISQVIPNSLLNIFLTTLLRFGSFVFKIITLTSVFLITYFLWVNLTENRFYKFLFRRFIRNNILRVFIDLLIYLIFVSLLMMFLVYAIAIISTII